MPGEADFAQKGVKMNLNKIENDYYENTLKKRAANAPAGLSFTPAWLFDQDPVSPRMCRKFYEEVSEGLIPNIHKIGKRSQDGYIAI